MKVLLIRHFEVNFRWELYYSSAEFQDACSAYDIASVNDNGLRFSSDYKIVTSTLPRSVETAKRIFGREPDEQIAALCEVPISAFMQTSVKVPTFLWNIVGRILWRLNSSNQPETYRESQARINPCINSILAQNKNCNIVCHGWIIKLIIKHLQHRGFRGPNPLFIKPGAVFEFTSGPSF